MTSDAFDYQVKRPDLTREGASLRRAVRGELEWTRRQTTKATSQKMREPSTKANSGSDTYRKP
jgi:hypothetical protein